MQRLEWKSAHHAELNLGVTWLTAKKKNIYIYIYIFCKTLEQLVESQLPPFLTAMHHNVIALLGYDVADSMWYGVSKDGRTVVKSSSHSSKFIGAALSDWDAAKVKPTTILADMIENDLAITSATLTPRAEHVQSSNIGTKWGGQSALFYSIMENHFPVITKSLTTEI